MTIGHSPGGRVLQRQRVWRCPEILEALVAANAGDTAPYEGDPWTERLRSS
jgi:hypothetical protein